MGFCVDVEWEKDTTENKIERWKNVMQSDH